MPYLTPETLPAARACRELSIPDHPLILAAVNGAISELAQEWNWEQFGAVTPAQMADAMADMYYLYLEGCPVDLSEIGSVKPFITVPDAQKWLPCDGTVYQAADYPELYQALDSIFKIDPDMFFTPDLRGRTVIGAGQGPDLTNRVTGAAGGTETHTLTSNQMPNHTHQYSATHTVQEVAAGNQRAVIAAALTNVQVSATGGGAAHNNMQPYRVLPYYVRARP